MNAGRNIRIWIVLFLLLFVVGAVQAADLTMSVIDVGQGDSILIQFPNGKNMLLDAGTHGTGNKVVHYLESRGVRKLDIAVATHPHEDHIGGMVTVLDSFPLGKFWDSGYIHGTQAQREMLTAIKKKGIRFGIPKAGFIEHIGDASIYVLAPKTVLPGNANNNSLVLRIVYGSTSFLLASDMESEERHTVQRWPESTVLKVAHHGSRNGTDSTFLYQVKPHIAVISCGRNNQYGHPHKSTLAALKSAGIATFITAQSGTVVLVSNGKHVSVKTLGNIRTTGNTADVGGYIGNVNSLIFHRPTCSSLPSEKNRMHFRSREEAINAGYRPCRRCNP